MPRSQVLLIILLKDFTMANAKIVNLVSEYVKIKIYYQYLKCNKNYKKHFKEDLLKSFANTYKLRDEIL